MGEGLIRLKRYRERERGGNGLRAARFENVVCTARALRDAAVLWVLARPLSEWWLRGRRRLKNGCGGVGVGYWVLG